VGEALDVTVDASTSGIVSVLVFGAGTNYALLLVSRYREELRRTEDRRTALRDAYRGAVPAILASNITVVLALLTLLLATLPNYRSLGLSAAVGLLVALVYALIALPAALAVCGRGLFWPFIPRPGQHHGRHEAASGPATPEGFDEEVPPGVWGRIAARVVKRPVTVLVSCVLLLAVLALGLIGTRVGLSQTEQFRTASESAAGLETAAEHFPAGVTDPVTVLTRTGTEAGVAEAAQGVEGVVSARPAGESGTGWSRVTVVLDAAPATDRSEDSVVALREAVDTVPGSEALVGGSVAEAGDTSEGNIRDLTLIAPLILLVVFVVLILVLRSLVAPLLVLTATALSSVAALGLGTFVTTQILGFPGLDVAVPLYSFLFLVALGVDYSIFLTIRAREEAGTHATREAMVRAVALTGGVITSAGIVLASVFVVLGVLPLIVLTQVGVIVALGVLLDTFIVRTLVVPALFTLVGDKVWWPGDPRGGHRRVAGADRTADGTGTVGPDSGGSHPDTPRRPGSRLRGLVTALAVAPLLAAGLGAAPVAGAQDLTDGGRLGGGSSQLLPDGVALGSLGGPELTQVDSVDLERYAGEWFQVAAIPQPYTLRCTNDT
ncbi:MAG: MMPL family transporter, partial [Dietzia sp.]|nr:MMPL family transporter [Dietzia sp.]